MNFQEVIKRKALLENEILAKLFSFPSDIPKAMARLNPEDFGRDKKVFEIFIDCYKNDKNYITELSQRSKISLNDFVGKFSYRPIEKISKELRDINNAIKVYWVLENSVNNFNAEDLDYFVSNFQRDIVNIQTNKEAEQSTAVSVIADFQEKQANYKEKFKNHEGIIGISTGYEKIDNIIDGFRPEHLWVIGAYTNMGKTACSLNFTSNLIKQGKRVVFFSLEMSKTDILSRLLGIMTGQSGLTILKGFEHNEEDVEKALSQIKASEFSVYNQKTELSEIENTMFEENLTKKVDLFVIDFLQLVNVKGAKTEYETISTAILELQQLARKLQVPIMVLSQISNEGARHNNEMVMAFKGSGSIASASDLALEINIGEDDVKEWKQKMYNGEPVNMVWNIRKNRHGKVGSIDMKFNGRTGVFETSEYENL